jgi:hypothetical protein
MNFCENAGNEKDNRLRRYFIGSFNQACVDQLQEIAIFARGDAFKRSIKDLKQGCSTDTSLYDAYLLYERMVCVRISIRRWLAGFSPSYSITSS